MSQLRATAPTFTRPNDTTAYASGDLVANSTTAGSVTALAFLFDRVNMAGAMVRRATLLKSNNGVTSAAFRLHLFSAVPTFTSAGDNSAISSVVQGNANYLGALDITGMTGLQDGANGNGIPLAGTEIIWQPNTGGVDALNRVTLYGVLEARGAYAPAAQETFSVALDILPIPNF